MTPTGWRFHLPETGVSLAMIGTHWHLPGDLLAGCCVRGPAELAALFETNPPAVLVDLGLRDLLAFQGEAGAKKSNRFLEGCPFGVRLAVDARAYLLEGLESKDPDDWDNAGKQLAWRLGAQPQPALILWDANRASTRGLKILRESLELWADPHILHWEINESRDGAKATVAGLAEKLSLPGLTCP